jgi:cell division septation protein DedD
MQANPSTRPELLPPIARYFAHETTSPEAIARCFSEDAVVKDEGREHHGRAAIAAWNEAAVTKYEVTSEPLTAETSGERTTVTARVTGRFPGSPLELRFRFTVAGDFITRLEIMS